VSEPIPKDDAMAITSIYKLSSVKEVIAEQGTHGESRIRYAFSVVGVNGKPLVSISYEAREGAEKVREQMTDAVSEALQTMPFHVR
jgi:hypothetical protein